VSGLGWHRWADRLRRGLRAASDRPALALLAVAIGVELARLLADRQPADAAALVLLAAAGAALAIERDVTATGVDGRAAEAESFARILHGLSRSVSPDAIVDAIVEELGAGAGADHVAVVRRRPESRNLEAVLRPTRPGAPTSRTYLPLAELEEPLPEAGASGALLAVGWDPRHAAVPIEPDAEGDPALVRLGLAPGPGEPVLAASHAQRATAGSPVSPGTAGEPRARLSRHWGALAHAGPRRAAVGLRTAAGQRIADRVADRLRSEYGLRNVLAAPLRVGRSVEGAIILARRTDEPWAPRARRLLAVAAVEASATLARMHTLRDAELRAATDALTGLPNRRYFDEYVGLLAGGRRAGDTVGVLMADIDRFKRLNDTCGHAVGDHVLREVARAISGAVREGDVPARFGGEEFVVLLRDPGRAVAIEVGERVRRAVAALDLRRLGVPGVSVSVGVAVADRPDADLDRLIDEADRALYRAKRAGRDRVVAA